MKIILMAATLRNNYLVAENGETIIPGILELCNGGTIFISDVASINEQGQKLLTHLMQKKQFRRIWI